MPLSRKRTLVYGLMSAAAVVLSFCLRFVFQPLTHDPILVSCLRTLRWSIHITLVLAWCLSIRRRILHPARRRLLLSVGIMLLLCQMIRIVKYDYLTATDPLGRYCWYSYYIFLISIPLLGVFIVSTIGKPASYRFPGWMYYLFIPALFLIAIVFTNDFHRMVFFFPNGIDPDWDNYRYGALYFVIMIWSFSLTIFFAIRLLMKSFLPGSKIIQMSPLLVIVIALLYGVGYCLGLYSGDMTATCCLIIIMLLESAIQSGLIPSNTHYSAIFHLSSISAQIFDQHLAIRFRSASAPSLDRSVIEQAIHAPVHLHDSILCAQAISGGYVLWQDNIKTLVALTENLREANESLEERNTLIQSEIELRKKKKQIDEKNRLLDMIAQEIAPRLNRANELLQMSSEHPEQTRDILSQLCVISAYIKRRSNLILLKEDMTQVSIHELVACVRESLDNLRLCGILTYLDSRCGGGQAPIRQIIVIYDWFEDVTELLIDHLSAMVVTVEYEKETLRMRIQAGFKEAIASMDMPHLPGGTVTCDNQGEDWIITAALGQEGSDK